MARCASCGSEVASTRFCTSCGARLPTQGIEEIAVGALLEANALGRVDRCVNALVELANPDPLLIAARVDAAGTEGVLALTIDELLFANEAAAEITGEALSDIRTCFVDPDGGHELVVTLDDGSVLAFQVRGSREDAQRLASAIWSAALPPPPAVPTGVRTTPNDVRTRLAKLKELHDSGLITAEDYELRRRTILEEI